LRGSGVVGGGGLTAAGTRGRAAGTNRPIHERKGSLGPRPKKNRWAGALVCSGTNGRRDQTPGAPPRYRPAVRGKPVGPGGKKRAGGGRARDRRGKKRNGGTRGTGRTMTRKNAASGTMQKHKRAERGVRAQGPGGAPPRPGGRGHGSAGHARGARWRPEQTLRAVAGRTGHRGQPTGGRGNTRPIRREGGGAHAMST